MELEQYLARIDYDGTPKPDRATLFALHRHHLTAIAYENFDIHLGGTLGFDIHHIYDKIVRRGRGGWCYEMNLLLAWALRAIGFNGTMLGAAVGVKESADRQHMDHMALRVVVDDEPWLLDAGFGNAFLEPLPLREGSYEQGAYTFQLRRDGDYWCFQTHLHGGSGFDFLLQPRTPDDFATRCQWLQSSPESAFTRLTVCHRFRPDYSIVSLRNAVLTTVDGTNKTQRIIDTLEAYHATVTQDFGLRLSNGEIAQLWAKVWPAHLAWVQAS